METVQHSEHAAANYTGALSVRTRRAFPFSANAVNVTYYAKTKDAARQTRVIPPETTHRVVYTC